MSIVRWTLSIFTLFLSISAASGDEALSPDPLFQSNDVLDVNFSAPLTTLLAERPVVDELPATFRYTNALGQSVELEVKVRTRGRFRRDHNNCRFPPLRLNFETSQTKDTLFHKQDKVKLVTHCQNSSKYEQALLSEFAAYRLLNVMSNISFRVRMLKITYSDREGKRGDEVRYGFIIEHRDRLARRIGKPVLDIPTTSYRSIDPAYMNLVSLYHYLIGNTDFSQVRTAAGERCCHNHVLFGTEGGRVWSVPYDFDQSGLVNAPHARPAERFKLRDVTQRLYRGRCFNIENLPQTIADFQDKKHELLAAIGDIEILGAAKARKMTNYIEKFYDTLESERRINSEFIRKCI